MNGYLVSSLMGLAVGVAYGLIKVHSPAPPLVGLLGMVLGEQAVNAVRHHVVPPAKALTQQPPNDASGAR
jgi:XapX domain-containing protein